MVLPYHVGMIQQNLFHYIESDLRDGLLLLFCLENGLGQLDCLEGDLVQDALAQFLID